MSSRDDHFELGFSDASRGEPRYVFQDPVLQERYDRGYKAALGPKPVVKLNRCRACGTRILDGYTYCNGCQ